MDVNLKIASRALQNEINNLGHRSGLVFVEIGHPLSCDTFEGMSLREDFGCKA